jgi:hypothetical protein
MRTGRSQEEESTEDEGGEFSKKPAAPKSAPLPTTTTASKGQKTSKAIPNPASIANAAPKKAKGKKSSKREKPHHNQ